MTRDEALAAIRTAGYHGDYTAFVQAYVAKRVGYAAAMKAFDAGRQGEREGQRCDCLACQELRKEPTP